MWNNKMNIIQHIAQDFENIQMYWNPVVIINIFKSNCNLITHFFSVIVADYSYIYFVIKLHNFVKCN